MSGIVCPLCGGDMEDVIGGDGVQCDTCGFITRSDGTDDYSETGIAELNLNFQENT